MGLDDLQIVVSRTEGSIMSTAAANAPAHKKSHGHERGYGGHLRRARLARPSDEVEVLARVVSPEHPVNGDPRALVLVVEHGTSAEP